MNAASGTAQPFPWEEVMELGLGRLRMNPDAFWRMTPKELSVVVQKKSRADTQRACYKAALEELLKQFPDSASIL